MKRFLYVALFSVLISACSKDETIVDPYTSGDYIAEIQLGATPGTVSVSIETNGTWRIESDQTWLKTDVTGRKGNGAFTVYYESNQSDVHEIRDTRVAKVAIRLEETMKTDTLVFVQRGLMPADKICEVTDDPAVKVEYRLENLQEIVLVCCSSDGNGDVQSWIESQNADIVVLDGQVNGQVSGLNVVGCDFAGKSVDEEFEAFRSMIQNTYNSGPDAGDDWIYAGQMYHLSAMQTDYATTPQWYPQSTEDPRLKSDIYAWQNNLYDCVWMYSQDYVATYTDPELGAYSADYVYVSPSVFSRIESVELLDIEGLSHKPIKVTFKY